MLLRLYNDNSELIDHSKNRDLEAKAREAEAEAKKDEAATTGADEAGGVKLDAKDPAITKTEASGEEEAEPTEGEQMETEA